MTLSRPQPTVTVLATRRRTGAEATWLGIDSRRALSGSDQALVTRLAEALMAADRLQLELPALLHLMRDHQAGQPRAQSLTPSSGSSYIDDDTERPTGHHDPTGDAGIAPDQAARDQREIRRHLQLAMAHLDQAIGIGHSYPSQAGPQPEIDATPGTDWCRCCWKDDHYCEPIPVDTEGVPYYRGLCRWCGAFASREGFEPPTDLVVLKHRGERITAPMVAAAKAEHRRLNPPKKSSKKRSKAK